MKEKNILIKKVDKKIENKTEIKNKKSLKQLIQQYKKRILLVLIAVIFSIILFIVWFKLIYLNNKFSRNKQEKSVNNQIIIETTTKQINNLIDKVNLLSNNITSLKLENESLKDKIQTLHLELTQIKSQEPKNNLNNLKLLITLIKLKNNFDNGFNYNNDLKLLKIFSKNSSNSLNEMVIELEYTIEKIKSLNIEDIFLKEMETVLSQQQQIKTNNKLLSVFYKNFSIRKISNFSQEDKESLDYKIQEIQQNLETKQYRYAIENIEKYNLTNDFKNTVESINLLLKVNNIFNSIVDMVYLGYLD